MANKQPPLLREPIVCILLPRVHSDSQSERFYAEMSAKISALPAEAQHDAVFALFGIGLKMMDSETISELREELIWRFPQRPNRRDLGTVLIEIIDGHLALRQLSEESDGVEHADSE